MLLRVTDAVERLNCLIDERKGGRETTAFATQRRSDRK
jgi:hypothetical protein